MIRNIYLFLGVGWIAFVLNQQGLMAHGELGAETLELDYEDIPAVLDRSSAKLKALDAKISAGLERQGYLDQSFFPKFNFYAAMETFRHGSSPIKTQPTASAMVSVNLYNGGQDQLMDAINQNAAAMNVSEKGAIRKSKLARVRSLFWEYLYYDKVMQLHTEAVNRIKNVRHGAQKRIDAGIAAKSDSLEFELKLFELDEKIALLARQKENAKVELLAELGLDKFQDLHVDTPFEDQSFWKRRFAHNSSHHDDFLAKYEKQKVIKELQMQRAESRARPEVNVFGGVQQHNERDEEEARAWDRFQQVVGVSVGLKLDTSYLIKKEKSALLSEISALEFERQAELVDIEKHLAIDEKQIEYLHQRILAAPKHLSILERYQKMTLEDYRYGVKSSDAVIEVIMKFLEVHLEYAEIVKELNSLISHMESYFG